MEVGGRIVKLQGAVLCLLGDTLGSNFIGGFKEGVGFSLRKCRRCMASNEDISKKVYIIPRVHNDNTYICIHDTIWVNDIEVVTVY